MQVQVIRISRSFAQWQVSLYVVVTPARRHIHAECGMSARGALLTRITLLILTLPLASRPLLGNLNTLDAHRLKVIENMSGAALCIFYYQHEPKQMCEDPCISGTRPRTNADAAS